MTLLTFTLNSGTKIPALGWGNGSGNARKTALESGKVALDVGIKHIDTAQGYANEEATGQCIVSHTNIKKDDIFVTSKLSERSDGPVPLNEVKSEIEGSIKKLGFIPDLFLIHNPFVVPEGDLKKTWQILEDLKLEGKLKDIGVSNFRPQDLELILDGAKVVPAVNQIEYHPYLLSHLEPVLKIQEKHNILTEAYGPLTPILRHPSGGPLKPILTRIANRINKDKGSDLPISLDEVAILLLWTRAKGVIAVTASGNPENIKKLSEISYLPDGLLTSEEVEEISEVGKKVHFRHYTEHMEVDFALPSLPDGQ